MTKPTPAQIEAALEAFCKSAGYPMEARYAEGSNLKRDLTAALTAAAEVGGRTGMDDWQDAHNASLANPKPKPLDPTTIERCVQVVVELRRMTWDTHSKQALSEAIAAIRAQGEEND